MNNIFFWIFEGIRGIKYHRLSALVSLLGMSLSLWIFGMGFLVQQNAQRYRAMMMEGLKLEVFLEPGIDDGKVKEIREQIEGLNGINKVKYISPEDAAEDFAEEFGGEIFDILEENPLPSSFRLTLEPSSRSGIAASAIMNTLSGLSGVDEVVYPGELVELLEERFRRFIGFFTALGIFFLLGTLFIFLQGIRLSLISRKEYVEALFLTGTRISTLKLPFLMEGVVIGTISGGLALIMVYTAGFLMNRYLLELTPVNYMYLLIPAGCILGGIAAALSLKINLKKFLVQRLKYEY